MDLAMSAEQRMMADTVGELVESWLAAGTSAVDRWSAVTEVGIDMALVDEAHDGLGLGLSELLGALRALGPVAGDWPWAATLVAGPLLAVAAGTTDSLGRPIGVAIGGRARFADRLELVADVSGDRVALSAATTWTPSAVADLLGADTWSVASAATPPEAADPAAVRCALAAGRVAEAAVLLGVAEHALRLAVDHAKVRAQFGRPIGEFQAVKHLLAEARTELAFADPVVLGAALAVDAGSPLAERDAAAALLVAAETADLAVRTAIQVHGAIGYTAELPLGRLLSAARHGVESWGGRAALAEAVETALLEADAHLGDGAPYLRRRDG